MIREVDLVDYYLPSFMQDYKEPVAALNSVQEELKIMWSAVDRVLYNHFISTADEYGISRFESILGIYPSAQDTLESRRARVQSQWFKTIPYTMKTLLEKLTQLCDGSDFTLTYDFKTGYTVTLTTSFELYGQTESLAQVIGEMLPCNVVLVSNNIISVRADGCAMAAGGTVSAATFFITNDFTESSTISGTANAGIGIAASEFIGAVTE